MNDDELLATLRDRVLDDDRTVMSLLRLCIMFGKHVGSDQLAHWASREAKGYGPDDLLPGYRSIPDPNMFADSINSGGQILRNQSISRWAIPSDLREMVPDTLLLRQPIDELERMISPDNAGLLFTHPAFPPLAMLWSQKPHLRSQTTTIERIYYVVADAQVAGIVGQVRTALVEMVADLTADTPIDQLPDHRKVDTLVQNYMYGPGEHNEITIHGDNTGVVGAGHASQQTQINGQVDGLTAQFDALREQVSQVVHDAGDRASLETAIDDFQQSLSATEPDADDVRRRGRLLSRLVDIAGTAALTTAANGLVAAGMSAAGIS